jgi:hypothetical protein
MRPDEKGAALEGDPQTSSPRTSPAQTSSPAQASLDDYVRGQGERASDTGLLAGERNDVEWAERAFAWIEALHVGTVVSADDPRQELGTSPAMGSVFRKAARAGLIVPFGYVESTAPWRHRGIQRTCQRWSP